MNKQPHTLEDMAHELAYEAIKEFGLHNELANNAEWDWLAAVYAKEVLESLKDKIAAKFLAIGEQRREEREAA